MNSHSLAVQEAGYLEQNSSDGTQSDTLSGTITANGSSQPESRMDSCQTPLYSAISEHSLIRDVRSFTEGLRMLSQGDSPASRSVSPENRREPKTKGICGRPQQPSLELSNPDLYCLKMCRESASICQWLSKTCADLGMKFQDPSSLGQTMLARRTGGKGSGLWPTMAYGSQWNYPGASKNAGTGLATAVKMWRTPSATEADHGGPNARDSKGGLHLSAQVMWPTPKSQNANGSGVHGNGGLDLQTAVDKYKIRIAPAISEEDFVQFAESLNPDWVEWLMGWPIGWTSPAPITELQWLNWSVDPADVGTVPRVATGVKDRVNRLKALGNGQVPKCVATAWNLLTQEK